MDYVIQTERLGLRPWRNDDLRDLHRINTDPEVMRYFPEMPDIATTTDFVLRQMAQYDEKGYCFFACEIRGISELAGFVGISMPRFETWFTPCIEIGWRLDKVHWNKGYATEAARACLEFGSRLVSEIYAFTTPDNMASRRVMEKVGMNHIGEFEHPAIKPGHPMRELVLYRIKFLQDYNGR